MAASKRIFGKSARRWRRRVLDYLIAQLRTDNEPWDFYRWQAIWIMAGVHRNPQQHVLVFARRGCRPLPERVDPWEQWPEDLRQYLPPA